MKCMNDSFHQDIIIRIHFQINAILYDSSIITLGIMQEYLSYSILNSSCASMKQPSSSSTLTSFPDKIKERAVLPEPVSPNITVLLRFLIVI